MGLKHSLASLANHIGLIRIITVTEEATHKPVPTRTVTLTELTTELRGDEVRTLAQLPAELSIGFEQIFSSAGIKPPAHGWDIEKLKTLLATTEFQGMAREAVQKALLGVLSSQNAQVEELVKDAMARDQAIDAFGGFVHQKLQSRREARQRKLSEIENQIQALHEDASRIHEEEKLDHERWNGWWQKKLAYEKTMATAIGFLLDKPIVTVDESLPPDTMER